MKRFYQFIYMASFELVTKLVQTFVFLSYYNWFLIDTFNLPQINYLLTFMVLVTVGIARMKSMSILEIDYQLNEKDDTEVVILNTSIKISEIISLTFWYFIGLIISSII